ncbi:amidase [Bradyrhizobium sp. CCGB12]|uniref:amidase n=1 Tax=Bradyrhizobium sp. CCGB12 TaxID=2949632 RepID=UPI0020B3B67B|nr:amidase [Bradyrhizobium sp. CCGB12]MCP3387772.1 amidase [Bradyrhizobium sp. CCGB12]
MTLDRVNTSEAVPAALAGLSATQASARVAAGELSAVSLVRSCLERIAERDQVVRAWSYLDPEQVLSQARARDAAPLAGPLHGVPIAVKDVIDVAGMPTEMGSPIYRGYRPIADAACVATLRSAGAVVLGKTVTAEFAGVAPGATTHPQASDHTPGGSSSGSAAAVADGMVPLAFGTQTGGSILRPAAFCGIVGFKPTFGAVSRAGLKLAAETLDTIGLMARNVDDVAFCWDVLVGRVGAVTQASPTPRLLLFRGHQWHLASSDTVNLIEATVRDLRVRGAWVDELPVPAAFAELTEARAAINAYERARAMAWEYEHHRDQISPAMSRTLAKGWSTSYETYTDALRLAERWRRWVANATEGYDGIVTPAVVGEAPKGLDSTGDASFQEIWTLLHLPALTLPLGRGRLGLPVGVQFVGRHMEDGALLALAKWVMSASSR